MSYLQCYNESSPGVGVYVYVRVYMYVCIRVTYVSVYTCEYTRTYGYRFIYLNVFDGI